MNGPEASPKTRRLPVLAAVAVLIVGVLAAALHPGVRRRLRIMTGRQRSVESVTAELRPRLRPGFERDFAAAGCRYPPAELTLVALKAERSVEAWAPDAAGKPRLVRRWPVLGASGKAGPKLREGDRQVPEGLYRTVELNPNSRFHLSIRVNYPNEFDRRMGERDGRRELGCDIFIHGNQASIGCLAMGDPAIEELFLLVAETGLERVQVILAPADMRRGPIAPPPDAPAWTAGLYEEIRRELAKCSPGPAPDASAGTAKTYDPAAPADPAPE